LRASTINFGQIDSAVALVLALFVNAAILIASAAVLRRSGRSEVAETQDAYKPFSQSRPRPSIFQ
jgi:manganese transport protein